MWGVTIEQPTSLLMHSGERLVLLAKNKKQETAGTIMPSVETIVDRCLV